MRILNCTIHEATEKQKQMGIVTPVHAEKIKQAILFQEPPTLERIDYAITVILEAMKENHCDTAMIGGAPFLQGYLEEALLNNGFQVAFAFTQRKSIEKVMENGEVEKVSYFDSDTIIIKDQSKNLHLIHL